jgi:hypothetical protein
LAKTFKNKEFLSWKLIGMVTDLERAYIKSAWMQYQTASPRGRRRLLRSILEAESPFSPAWSWYFFPDSGAAHRLHARYEAERLQTTPRAALSCSEWLSALRLDWLYAGPSPLLSALWEARFSEEWSIPTLQEALGPTTGLWLPDEQVWCLSIPYLVPDSQGYSLEPGVLPERCIERFRRLWILGGSWPLPVAREVWLRPLDLAWQDGWIEFYFALPHHQAPEPWVSYGLRCRLLTDWPGLGYDASCLTERGVLRPRLLLEPRVWHLEPVPGPEALPSTFCGIAAAFPAPSVSAGRTE